MSSTPNIALVLADLDGTLLTPDKVLTPRAEAAVQALKAAGIRFAITSGRPPLGMAPLFDALQLDTPIAGFNGGLFVDRDLAILDQKILPAETARSAIALIRRHGLDTWLYCGKEWLITTPGAPHVEHEAWTVKFEPRLVPDFDDYLDRVVKIVGVGDDRDRMRACEDGARSAFGRRATVNLSQPYYLDITHRQANKGAVVTYLSDRLGIPPARIATIGDQLNDVPMFKRSGFSIAMGNAPDRVKARASAATDSHDEEGFAKAMERHILGAGS